MTHNEILVGSSESKATHVIVLLEPFPKEKNIGGPMLKYWHVERSRIVTLCFVLRPQEKLKKTLN